MYNFEAITRPMSPGSLTVELYIKFCVDLYPKCGFHENLQMVCFLIAGHKFFNFLFIRILYDDFLEFSSRISLRRFYSRDMALFAYHGEP